MNGTALIVVMAIVAMLAFIYIASDEEGLARIGFMFAGLTGALALDVPWLTTPLVLAVVGVGMFGLGGIDRVPWEGFVHWLKHGLGDDWQHRHGGEDPGGNWRDARPDEGETGYRDDDQEGEQAGGDPPRATSTERIQALRILGLDERATDRDVRRAHRRLMKRHHPDRGGSTEMATRLNWAREVLLRQ